ncbi:MAG: hypothetical protein JKY42_07045 [Flavobacteriales bacterium]|nr:hypothetical protein [Flavobacteriales bacterium]
MIESVSDTMANRLRGSLLKIQLLILGCKVGKNLTCSHWPYFRRIPSENLTIGSNVKIGKEIHFEPLPSGQITIGDNCSLEENIVICSGKSVVIENGVSIGKNVTIRDDSHNISKKSEIRLQGWNFSSVLIKSDVRINRDSCILQGAQIPEGVTIEKNSVVIEKSNLDTNKTYQGIPVHLSN